MIDGNNTIFTAARKSLSSIKLNSRRRDDDAVFIVALDNLYRLRGYMVGKTYSSSDIDLVSNAISSIINSSNNISPFGKSNIYTN